MQPGLSLYNAFILLALVRRGEARCRAPAAGGRRGDRGGGGGGGRPGEAYVIASGSFSPNPLVSSPSRLSPLLLLSLSELWHEIPHMPLIWSEGAQE